MAGIKDIQEKNFLITGAASGLGALYAEGFLKEGAKNVAILDIAEEVGKATAAKLNQDFPGRVIFERCDVSNEEEISSAFQRVLDQYKQIDVIINNAGIMVDNPQMWRTACTVNWEGLVSFTMKGVTHMRKDRGGAGGTIINISSMLGLVKIRQLPIYSGSKAAVLHFSQCLSLPPFFEETGIRVLTFCLGATATPLLEGLSNRGYDEEMGKELEEGVNGSYISQQPESAAIACLEMFKKGDNSTVWASANDQPAKDVTSAVNDSHQTYENLFAP